jgi:hypothetical protein
MFDFLSLFPWLFKGKNSAQTMNVMTANDYYDRLRLIATTLFEWEGLPESCNARFLEKTLYTFGQALFVNDPDLGYLTLKCTPSGELNYYDEPLSYTANGVGYNKRFNKDECVVIRNNYLDRATDWSVVLFASRLTEAERTIDTNIKAQKTPYIVCCDQKDLLTMKNIVKQKDDNELTIFGSKSLNIDAIKVHTTKAEFVADKLQEYKQQIWNEAMTFFGINNDGGNTQKRERMITDEVNANNELISINAEAMLLTRQEACKQINKLYNLNVTVKLRQQAQEVEETEEGEENGEIHD